MSPEVAALLEQLPPVTMGDLEAEIARRTLLDFTQYTNPNYEANWHHRALCEYLDKVIAGDIRRLMVFMPAQNGKSELVSRRLPAFILGRDPSATIIACSYGADLASLMNRDVQRIIDGDEYRRVFPDTSLSGENVRTAAYGRSLRNSDMFEVVGHSGYYRSAGVGGAITGIGCQYGILDDPIKNREEAESEVYREKIWDWYVSTFYTRLRKNARVILTLTRWHEDDLAGRLLHMAETTPAADQWTVVRFPALAEEPRDPTDPRAEGDPLWPDRFPMDELERRRAQSGSYEWAAMYQQRPTPAGGGMFKREWFDILTATPTNIVQRIRFWDCAATADGGDYTVGTLVGLTKNREIVIEDVVRDRWSSRDVETIIKQTADRDGVSVRIYEEQEPGSAGKAVISARTRMLMGYAYGGVPATGDKVTRWMPFAAQCEAKNVKLIRGAWNAAWLDEVCTAPHGRHDDQVDSVVGGFVKLALGRGPVFGTARFGLD